MPHPAKSLALAPSINPERSATANSPCPLAPIHPRGAAYHPLSSFSVLHIASRAAWRGNPPTAGVGCRSARISRMHRPGMSSPRMGVFRCCTFFSLSSCGIVETCMWAQWFLRASRIIATTIACSLLFFSLCSSSMPMRASSSSVSPRRADPANAIVCIWPSWAWTSRSGVAPTKKRSPRCMANT